MKLQARPLHTQKLKPSERLADAELENLWLIPALNGKADPECWSKPGMRRVSELLERFQKVDSILKKLRPFITTPTPNDFSRSQSDGVLFGCKLPSEDLEELNRIGARILRQANDLLKRYKWTSSVEIDFGGSARESRDREENSWTEQEYHERLGVTILTHRFVEGDIDRYKRCDECLGWFTALTQHQRFCKDSCRKKYASGSDEYRLKRKLYMRRHRREMRAMSQTALRNARKGKVN